MGLVLGHLIIHFEALCLMLSPFTPVTATFNRFQKAPNRQPVLEDVSQTISFSVEFYEECSEECILHKYTHEPPCRGFMFDRIEKRCTIIFSKIISHEAAQGKDIYFERSQEASPGTVLSCFLINTFYLKDWSAWLHSSLPCGGIWIPNVLKM